jgi:hypothetical protein
MNLNRFTVLAGNPGMTRRSTAGHCTLRTAAYVFAQYNAVDIWAFYRR